MAIAQHARRGLTLGEFLRLPEEEPALEFEEGRITQKVSPKGQHSRLQHALCDLFNRITEPHKLALAFPELRASFGGRSYVPDVAVYRWERIPRTPEGEVADDFFEPPDIAVEIVSPGQSVNALVRRCLWYIGHGVQAAILVDPKDKSILLFRSGATPVPLHGADQLDLRDVVPGLQLAVASVFAALRLD